MIQPNKIIKLSASFLLLVIFSSSALAQKVVHHDLDIIVKPKQSRLESLSAPETKKPPGECAGN